MIDVSIITVNYRSKDHIERLIKTVKQYTKGVSWELIIVNNDQSEDLSDLVADDVRVFNEENNGFAAGCNRGASEARGNIYAFLNPDVQLTSDSLTQMKHVLDQDASIAIAGPQLHNLDGSHQPSVRRFPTLVDQLLILCKVPHLWRCPGPIKHYLAMDLDPGVSQNVDQVMGAYFVMPKEKYVVLNGFDEGFFMWFEEVDLCKRAVDRGWVVRYVADVHANHVGGGSFARVKTVRKQKMIRTSLRRYAKKHWGVVSWLALWFLEPAFIVLAIGSHVLKRY